MSSEEDDSAYRARLRRVKRDSVAQLLLRCARKVDERAIGRIRTTQATDLPPLRPAHTRLFPHLDLEGTRLTELARRMDITKQAVGQVVGDLEQAGIVERRPDPEDGRAKLVCFTPHGKESLFRGIAVLKEVEEELKAEIGATKMNQLHRALLAIDDFFERDEEDSNDG